MSNRNIVGLISQLNKLSYQQPNIDFGDAKLGYVEVIDGSLRKVGAVVEIAEWVDEEHVLCMATGWMIVL